MSKFTHLDANNRPQMVDVGDKSVTKRSATAQGRVQLSELIWAQIDQASGDIQSPKGSVFQTAHIAGVMGAKKTAELIPFCHQLNLNHVKIELALEPERRAVLIHCTATTQARTGVEMEAITGVMVTALTIVDMCKAIDHAMTISDVRVIAKQGGQHDF